MIYIYIEGDPNEKKKKISITSSTKQLLTRNQIEKEKKDIKDPQVSKQQKLYLIVQGVTKNLCLSDTVIQFTLYGLTLTPELTSFISEGLLANRTLELFAMTHCTISLDAYEILLKGLFTHETVMHIDLSGNGFNDKYANMISRIIARQTQRRDMVIWSYGLRNEYPSNNDFMKGLVSMDLSDNQFSEIAADSISNTLSYDQYMRSIDLSGNLFSKEACKKFIRMLRKNTSLLNLDLKDNLGYDPEIHARIVMKMSKNIQYLNQQVINSQFTVDEFNEMKQYINLSFFNVDIPDEVIDMYNNRISSSNTQNISMTNKSLKKNNNRIEEKKNDDEDKDNHHHEAYNENEYEEEQQERDEEQDQILLTSNDDVGYLKSKNKTLVEQNLILKRELIEMRALKIHNDLVKNIDDKESKSKYPHIESNYNRIVKLLSELTDLMDNVETTLEKAKTNQLKGTVNLKNNQLKEQDNLNDARIDTNNMSNRNKSDEEVIGEESEEREQPPSKRKHEEPKVIMSSVKEKQNDQGSSLPINEYKIEQKKRSNDLINKYRKEQFEAEDEDEDDEYLDEEDMRQNIYNNPYAQQYMMYDDGDYDDDDNNEQFKKVNKSF